MSLLPKSHTEFSHAEYWERFFKKRGAKAFEWYGEYGELCGILHKYIKPADKVLNVGCGNSTLSADLYDVGYHSITNIDISEVVIRQMKDINSKQRPDMKFIKMDIYEMEFGDGDFSVVLDKGTLDAIMTDSQPETIDKVDKMFAEISRVLRVGGRYVCVSLAQEHIIHKVLQYFTTEGWMVRICRVIDDKEEEEEKEFYMPVFVYVLTKFRKMPNMKQILEVAYFEDRVERYETCDQVLAAVKEMQHYGVIRQQLNKRNQAGEHISLDLYSSASSTPRYTLHIVDRPVHSPNKFAIFIVPEGRETEWLFATDAGRRQLADSASFVRLVVVTLHRDHTYGDLETVKGELSSKVMELAPQGLGSKQVPFLSVGDDINKRTLRHRGNSEMSGEYVVEDVDSDGQLYRRLIFLSNERVVQSAARLKKEITKRKSGKKRSKPIIDTSYLSCQHHPVMVSGLAFLQDFHQTIERGISVLVVGLGGGGLPVFLHKHYPKLKIEAVEIDPVMVTIATEWFGFVPDERLEVHVADGLKFIEDAAKNGSKYDVVMLDVNSHDPTLGMSCPPKAFVEQAFLTSVNNTLHTHGVLMINLACRDPELKVAVTSDIKAVFQTVYSQQVPEEINVVVFALPRHAETPCGETEYNLNKPIVSALRVLQGAVQVQSRGAEVPNLTKTLNKLTLL